MKEAEYINRRLETRKDDRCKENKLNLDARLRGSIGDKRANEIINMIDKYKSRY